MDDDSNNLQNQNNEQQEERELTNELGQKTKKQSQRHDMEYN